MVTSRALWHIMIGRLPYFSYAMPELAGAVCARLAVNRPAFYRRKERYLGGWS